MDSDDEVPDAVPIGQEAEQGLEAQQPEGCSFARVVKNVLYSADF